MIRGLDQGAPLAGVLEDELRRRLYLFIRRAGRPISRHEAATEAGISRKLAAFHLDKLVEKGLLTVTYARPPGRSGRGAGRTAKFYEPSDLSIEFSIPERRYDLVGDLLVTAIQDGAPGEPTLMASRRASREAGLALGRTVRRDLHLRPPGPERALAVAEEVLARYGFEPDRHGGEVILRNCPFQALARKAPELVCEMNQAFIEGMVRGLGNESLQVLLDRAPGRCCVKLRSSQGAPLHEEVLPDEAVAGHGEPGRHPSDQELGGSCPASPPTPRSSPKSTPTSKCT